MKYCSGCKTDKPVTDFYRNVAKKDNLANWCKTCSKASKRKWSKNNPDHEKDYSKKYRAQNRDKLKDYAKQYNVENAEHLLNSRLLYRYNLTLEQYNAILAVQNHRCAICNREEDPTGRAFAVDHDHKCCPGRKSCGKCIRGLLCTFCNQALGKFQDSVEVLQSAISYVNNVNP